MITADCGGSNGARVRLWKIELQKLADETGLTLWVCHYPPGTSKWNKIEHNAAVGNKLKLVVRVHIGKRQIIILPDRDVDAGIVAADEELTVAARDGMVDVRKVRRSRPAQPPNMAPGFSI
jgi:hypothetical protein